jgi:hypothetical protein
MYPPSAYQTLLSGLPAGQEAAALAEWLYQQVFRRDFDRPGFALATFKDGADSSGLRALMVLLKDRLNDLFQRETGRHLMYLSMARFDQQVTTKFHVDGAPDESFLMLGYEPSEVDSRLAVADYTRAAHDRGISPAQLLADFNPMYTPGEQLLAPYITRLDGFDPAAAHILLLNNSRLPYRPEGANLLGVMHQATIVTPRPEKNRVVNSTMMTSTADPTNEAFSRADQDEFIQTKAVSGKPQDTL